LSDKSLIERQVAIKFARSLQISLSSLLNNHINLFLSDNSGKKLLFILGKKVLFIYSLQIHRVPRHIWGTWLCEGGGHGSEVAVSGKLV
jgi:hypothetical protein